MRGPKLARLRIEMLAPALQCVLLERLSVFQQMDALLAAWEKAGWRDDLRNAWDYCLFDAAQAGRRDVVARLVQLRGISEDHDDIPLNVRLLLLQEQPEKFLHLLEEAARRNLTDPKNLDYVDVACALTEGGLPGLGTLVARGAAAVASPLDAEMLFESICKVRDQMDLPPEDPGEWMLDHLYNQPEELDEETREELATARRQMDAAAAEASRLRAQLAETRAQLERQERLAARKKTAPPTPAAPVTAPEPSAAELRKRIDELKSALKERHTERNALRRELNEVLKETAELRESKARQGPDANAASEPDREEQALLAEETTALQPVRVPVFPGRFLQTLESFPGNVSRGVMALVGRLAAGEPAAFVGMRRLRVRHEICRVRLAGDYRLLFKLQPEKLEILDLINRRDFEKWLKTLG
jgi:mRNA-degrading endonuclease RelE of RelBE toxin-antitoxin system